MGLSAAKIINLLFGGGRSSLLDSLISYWKMDESSDGSTDITRIDSFGSNDLSSTNTVASTTGKINNAALFVAANSEKLSITDAAQTGLDPGVSDFTVAFWIYINSFPVSITDVLSKGRSGEVGGDYIFAARDNGTFLCRIQSDTHAAFNYVAAGLTTGAWIHYIIDVDRSANLTIYKNNASQGTLDISAVDGDSIDNAYQFQIGNGSNGAFDGIVDEVGIWMRRLTAAERAALYNSGNGLSYPF